MLYCILEHQLNALSPCPLGGSSIPAVGFGFGDAVIVELLKMKGN